MKLNKFCLFTLFPTIVATPLAAASCSVYAENAWMVYNQGEFELGTHGKFECPEVPVNLVRDQDLVIKFVNNHKYKDKLVYKDLTENNVYYQYKTGADSYTNLLILSSVYFTIENNVITINKDFVNNILDMAKDQSKYKPTLSISILDIQVNTDEITWDDVAELSDTPEETKNIFTVGDVLPLKVNGITHNVRIVDFEKFFYDNEHKATFVFEFADLITGSDGNVVSTIWDNKIMTRFFVAMKYYYNYDYRNSVIEDKVKGDVTNWVKEGLGSAASKMKQIKRPMSYCTVEASEYNLFRNVNDYAIDGSTTAYCFLPSVTNIIARPVDKAADVVYYMNTGGDQFKYYAQNQILPIKHAANSNTMSDYWTCSPNVNQYNEAWYISGTSCGKDYIYDSDRSKGIAPCFCM